MTRDQILARARALAESPFDGQRSLAALKQGLVNLYAVVYGPTSPQVKAVTAIGSKSRPDYDFEYFEQHVTFPSLIGAAVSLMDDIEGGVVGTLELRGAGVALSDGLALAKEVMRDTSESALSVAAVLAAAAFEDTMRRMGSSLAGVKGRPSLRSVVTSLKGADLLPGAMATSADGLVQFRNDALHADWSKVDRALVGSCIAFTEALLLRHFSV